MGRREQAGTDPDFLPMALNRVPKGAFFIAAFPDEMRSAKKLWS